MITLRTCLTILILTVSTLSMAHAQIKIVTTIPPINALVQQLVKDSGSSVAILSERNDTVHEMQLSKEKLTKLANADVVVVFGLAEPDFLGLAELEQLRGDSKGIFRAVEILPSDFLLHTSCHAHDDHETKLDTSLVSDHDDDDHEHEHEHDNSLASDHDDDEHEHEHDNSLASDHDDDDHEHEHDNSLASDHDDDDIDEECIDSHFWLSPTFARQFLREFTAVLQQLDNSQAAVYQANLTSSLEALSKLEATILSIVANKEAPHIIVWHDAYGYFVREFGVPSYTDAAVPDLHASSISGKRLLEIRRQISEHDKACLIFGTVDERTRQAGLFADIDVNAIVANPIGTNVSVDEQAYERVLLDVANAFGSCTD